MRCESYIVEWFSFLHFIKKSYFDDFKVIVSEKCMFLLFQRNVCLVFYVQKTHECLYLFILSCMRAIMNIFMQIYTCTSARLDVCIHASLMFCVVGLQLTPQLKWINWIQTLWNFLWLVKWVLVCTHWWALTYKRSTRGDICHRTEE